MDKRKLRDIEVSPIGMGCMGFSHGYGEIPTRDYSIEAIRKAYDFGCTFFDTAESYGPNLLPENRGHNERIVGEAVLDFRKEVVLATKLHLDANEVEENGLENVMRRHLTASLERLQTDYVDLYYLHRINPQAMMIVSPADHLILNEQAFDCVVRDTVDFADTHNALMTIGINPTRPETGYGYIQMSDDKPISKVKCFTEKPNLELAQTFIQCGEFLWNSGIFIWKVSDIIAAVEKYLPEHHALFSAIECDLGTEREKEAVEQVFSQCRAISIDYGVMEKADNVFVHRGDFGWSDVGTWGSIYQHSRKDKYANAKPAEGCYTYDTRNSIISLPEGKIAVINGLRDYIVVDTDDVLMICPRAEEQNIKKFIDEVKFQSGDKHI